MTEQRATEAAAYQVNGLFTATHVDCIDLAQEGQRLVNAQLTSAGHECADILRQATAAEAQPRVEEAAANSGVHTDGVGKRGDIRTCDLTDFRDRVDKGNLGGEERIRRHLHQLCGGGVRDDKWCLALKDRAEALAQAFLSDRFDFLTCTIEDHPRLLGAQHHTVRLESVLYREALAQELRVPGDLETGVLQLIIAGCGALTNHLRSQLLQARCGTDGHSGLTKH